MNKTLIVNQSNELITAQYRMPLLSKKVFAMAIARLNPKGTILTSCFNAKDLSSLIDSNDPNLPARILGAANDIMHIALTLKQGDKETITRAFSQVTFDYSTKDIKVEFPTVLKEHLLDLQSQYSNYLLQNIIDLTNSAHIRLFEILRSKANLRSWVFNIEDLFYTLQLPESYRNFALLEQKFLLPAQKELDENTSLKFTYEKITRGKKVIKLKFNITYSELTEPELEPEPINQVPEVKKTIKKPFEAEIKEVYDHYMTVFNRDNRYTLTPDRQAVIRARLEEKFTVEELKKHIDLHKKSDFHNGVNDQKKFYIDLKEHIFNKTKFDIRQQNIEVVKPKSTYQKPGFSDSQVNNDEQVVDSIDFIFFVEKYYINNHNYAYKSHRKTAETFPEFWLRTMSLRR